MITYWRTHTTFILIGGVLAIVIASIIAFIVTNFEPRTEVRIATATFQARVADSQEERRQGLSGVTSMKDNEALLMVFDSNSDWGIWMKDMKIPLDIIWLDEDQTVVHVVKNASPELGTTTSFKPTEPARYVVEMNAGLTTTHNIKVGDTAEFVIGQSGESQ